MRLSKSGRKVTIGVLIVAVLLAWWAYKREQSAYAGAWFKVVPTEQNALFSSIQEQWRHNDFEAATRLATTSLRGTPSDDILYYMLSQTYFARTQSDPSRSPRNIAEWVKLGIHYAEQAHSANPSDIVNDYNVAQAYATAGMNSEPPLSCDYYRKSITVLETLTNNDALKHRSGIIEGEAVNLAPYRRKLADELHEVHQLFAHCSEQSVQLANSGSGR